MEKMFFKYKNIFRLLNIIIHYINLIVKEEVAGKQLCPDHHLDLLMAGDLRNIDQ